MRLILLALLALVLASPVLAQTAGQPAAQTAERHADVRLRAADGDARALVADLAAAGLLLDHAVVEKQGGAFVIRTILSASEQAIARATGAGIEVVEADLAARVRERSNRGCPELEFPVTGSMGCFLTLDEIAANLDAMAAQHPDLVTVKESIGQGHDGNDIWMVEISDNAGTAANDAEGEPEVLYVGVHHAREAITPIAVLYWMWTLLDGYGDDDTSTFLVDNRRLFFVPVLNPDGYAYNQQTDPSGGGFWRKNRRANAGGSFGVDLNRNYDYLWGLDNQGSSPLPTSETYRGPSGFSEPETQALRDFLEDGRSVRFAMNYHSYSNLLLYPWGYAENTYTEDHDLFVPYGQEMTALNGYAPGTGPDILYSVNGDSDDWMYGEQSTKPKIFSFTPEVGSASDGFWPDPSRIEALALETLPMSRLAALYAGGALSIRNIAYQDDGANGSVDPGESVSVTFDLCNIGLAPLEGQFEVRMTSSDPELPVIIRLGGQYIVQPLETRECIEAVVEGIEFDESTPLGTVSSLVITVEDPAGEPDFPFTTLTLPPLTIGTPEVFFTDDATSLDAWTAAGGWGLTGVAASAPTAFTDSPNGDYANDTNLTLTLAEPLDFSDVEAASLSFQARWDIEDVYDWATVELSVGGGAWTELAGLYTSTGGAAGVQTQGGDGYDGVQATFVTERMDLAAAVGSANVRLRFRLQSDGLVRADGFIVDDIVVSRLTNGFVVSDEAGPSAARFALGAPRPNPSSGAVRLALTLPAGVATVAVYDVLGRRVAILLDGDVPAGTRDLVWDGRDASGAPAAPGVYLVRASADGEVQTRRLVVTR